MTTAIAEATAIDLDASDEILAERAEELEQELADVREHRRILLLTLADVSAVLRREHEAKEPAEVLARIRRWDAIDEASQRAALHYLAAFYPASFDAMAADAEEYAEDAADQG